MHIPYHVQVYGRYSTPFDEGAPGFRRKAVSLGARFVAAEVVGLERAGGRIAGATLADGRRIACGALVLAAGPNSGAVAALAGVDLPVRPRKRSVFVFRTPAALPGFPLLIDATGVWCRPEGAGFICGVSPPERSTLTRRRRE